MGKRLAAVNRKKREVKKREEQVQLEKSGVNQYYGTGDGTILAVGVIGDLSYYIYRTKKGKEVKNVSMSHNPTISQPLPRPQTNKFQMD